jgi:hypothetical protein
LLLVVGLAGCETAFKGYPERPTALQDDLTELNDSISAREIQRCLDAGAAPDQAADTGSARALDPRSCRNRLIAARMYAIDLRFSEFEENLFREVLEGGFAATLATLGLTSAGALASGGASQVFSGIAALIIGGREAFQKEALAERTIVAIHTAMRANRAETALRLHAGLRQSIDDYPLAVALSDLNEYYGGGTVLGALIGITKSVGAEASAAEDRLREFRVNAFAEDESGRRLRAFIRPPDGDDASPVNEANLRALRAWLATSPVAGLPIENFLTNADLKELRERAVREIPVPSS